MLILFLKVSMNGIKITFNDGTASLLFNSINRCCAYFSLQLAKNVHQNNILHAIADINYGRTFLKLPNLDTISIFKPIINIPKTWYCDVCRVEMLNTSRLNHVNSIEHSTNLNREKQPIINTEDFVPR